MVVSNFTSSWTFVLNMFTSHKFNVKFKLLKNIYYWYKRKINFKLILEAEYSILVKIFVVCIRKEGHEVWYKMSTQTNAGDNILVPDPYEQRTCQVKSCP